ncbi:MAG: 7-cyano-7-deazaguanine synthase QueC [Cellvibrionales bacterium]|jgi:7-cyano-7-deazaguanine synthase|nr:7-cyano-7-deazaguanine synthase QueC [Cellvibrionales bacterium]
MAKRAVILTSGGLDSATVLAMAHSQGVECYALSFDYGQRHRAELAAAARVAAGVPGTVHKTVGLDLRGIGGSALTDDAIDVPVEPTEGIPVTYVPARNTVFLSIALGWAEVLEAGEIYIGVNAVDYSGYPDCRPAFIEAFESMAATATKAGVEGNPVKLRTPIINLSKADIIRAGIELGVDYSVTISCYQATGAGLACGVCDSCRLRRQGFEEAGVPDPTRYV